MAYAAATDNKFLDEKIFEASNQIRHKINSVQIRKSTNLLKVDVFVNITFEALKRRIKTVELDRKQNV